MTRQPPRRRPDVSSQSTAFTAISRHRVFLAAVATWLVLEIASWLLALYLDTNVRGVGAGLVQSLYTVTTYLTGRFAIGFVLGGLVFSAWDLPVLKSWLRKWRHKRRNSLADAQLAAECEEVSRELYDHAVTIERLRNDGFWRATHDRTDHEKEWRDQRAAEAREEERVRRQVGFRVQSLLVKLQNHGVRMELWGLSLSHYDLLAASHFFLEIAEGLRSGTYLDGLYAAGRGGVQPRL
jgi:uncharacterized membrane protein YciS (DUF1049 family)